MTNDKKARLRQLMAAQTVATQVPRVEHRERSSGLGQLSLAQESLWFTLQLEGPNPAYNNAVIIRISGALDVEALNRAVSFLVQRHDSLRTAFVEIGGIPSQFCDEVADVRLDPQRVTAAEADAVLLSEARRPFAIGTDKPFRVKLFQESDERFALVLSMHHMISDAWSMGVFLREMAALYDAYHSGRELSLAPLPVTYLDYVDWERDWLESGELEEHFDYWRRQLKDVSQRPLLTPDLPQLSSRSNRGGTVEFAVPLELVQRLKTLSHDNNCSLYVTLLAALGVVLHRYSSQSDIAIGTGLSNRRSAELEGLIGYFVNTLVFRLSVLREQSFESALKATREVFLEALAHQDAPYPRVLQDLLAQRRPGDSPLLQVIFTFQNVEWQQRIELSSLTMEVELPSSGAAKVDFFISVQEWPEGLRGQIEYRSEVFEEDTVRRLASHYVRLLNEIVDHPEWAIGEIQILGQEEREQLIHEWDETEQEMAGSSVLEVFEAQVEKAPDSIAVVWKENTLSYRELNRRANQLAHYLRELGVGPEQRVGICVERGEMPVGVLAILKAGGAYVPLDPKYPVERLRYILEDSAPAVLLTQRHLQRLLRDINQTVPIVDIAATSSEWQKQAGTNPRNDEARLLGLNHLAYVIYTSGSSGVPKGVEVSHRGIWDMARALIKVPGIDEKDHVLQFASLNFDASVPELFMAWLTGASLHLGEAEDLLPGEPLGRFLQEREITAVILPPSLLEPMKKEDADTLRVLIVAGESCWRALVDEWAVGRGMFDAYGPTEITVCATIGECRAGGGAVDIGRPIEGARVYVLDQHLQPVPKGATGEICVGGVGVARGYLGRPALTAERFVVNPFGPPGSRMYRTGDLARWRADGTLEFQGRNDLQVKIRGHRIELGEIEERLVEDPTVRQAVVVARQDAAGDKRLVGYIVPRQVRGIEHASCGDEVRQAGLLNRHELLARLRATLPEYMVPSAFVELAELPLTSNGKIDRKSLPPPEEDAYAVSGYEPPAGEIETQLAAIWTEVLKCNRVGRNDNFFQLGGHSLLAVTLIERMHGSGFQVDVQSLFATPTLADLAATLERTAPAMDIPPNRIPSSCELIAPDMLPLIALTQEEIERIMAAVPGGAGNIQDIYPLAPLQQGILFHYLMGGEEDPYVVATMLSFDSRLRLDSYVSALQAVVDRHDILRTAILWEGLSEPVQAVLRRAPIPVEEIELDSSAGDASEQLYTRFNPRRYRINVREAPMLRLHIARDRAEERWLLMVLLHHLAGDHTTLEVMQLEVRAYLLGKGAELPVPLPFRNLVAQARTAISPEEHEAFFREMLWDIEEPTAPFGLLDVNCDGGRIEEARLQIDDDLGRRLRTNARRLGLSSASLCHLAWGRVLAKISGRDDVVFGTVLFGRMKGGEGSDRVMGLFINTLPMRLRIAGEGVEQAVRRTHILLADLMRHEHASLALAQRCSAVTAPMPLFSTLFNYRHSPGPTQEASGEGWEGIQVLRGEQRTNYPLTVSVDDMGESLSLDVQTRGSIDASRICEYMRTALASLVEALELAPETEVRAIDVLPRAERLRVLEEWKGTQSEYPRDKSVHQLFELQVEKTPNATAVVYEDRHFSYDELNRRSNQLARHLIELGVKPDSVVAICMERAPEMIIAVLGVLKAGGAYAPLDLGYPEERLRFMAHDSAPTVVLTQNESRRLFAGVENYVIVDMGESTAWLGQPDTNVEIRHAGFTSEHLAYVIYTSGSTGRPKGVTMTHRALVNLLLWQMSRSGALPPKRTLQFAAIGFDVAFQEVFLTLCAGGTLVLIDERKKRNFKDLVQVINTNGVERLFLPYVALQMLAESLNEMDSFHPAEHFGRALSEVVTAGEQLRVDARISAMFERLQHCTLENQYGPTETHVVTSFVLPRDIACWTTLPPIGRPIANTRIYILDKNLEPAPAGVVGEIYTAGAGLARGYLSRAELTAERFVGDPFTVGGERMYKTGDQGRWLADGTIEFLGRNDFQVKIRGFRIELGEIEARLAEHPGVAEAVVVARDDGAGARRLVAYYTVVATGEEHQDESVDAIGNQQLRSHLSATLPEYMVPMAYVRLDRMPLSPNGKLDRRALPGPKGDAYGVLRYEAPVGETESVLATIWAELLKVERVGRWDNFFDLGGHSLLAVRMVSRIQQVLGVEVAISELFANPAVAPFADRITSLQIEQFDPDEIADLLNQIRNS